MSGKDDIPEWEMIDWVVTRALGGEAASRHSRGDLREVDAVLERLAALWCRCKGVRPPGYAGALGDEPALDDPVDAPDWQTQYAIYRRDYEVRGRLLADAEEELRQLRARSDRRSGRHRRPVGAEGVAVGGVDDAAVADLERRHVRTAHELALVLAWSRVLDGGSTNEPNPSASLQGVMALPGTGDVRRLFRHSPPPYRDAATRWLAEYLRVFLTSRYDGRAERYVADSDGRLADVISTGRLPDRRSLEVIVRDNPVTAFTLDFLDKVGNRADGADRAGRGADDSPALTRIDDPLTDWNRPVINFSLLLTRSTSGGEVDVDNLLDDLTRLA
ncbi:hypothetical protein ACFV4N_18430 [Actinosynnema sp. NPDC059797]